MHASSPFPPLVVCVQSGATSLALYFSLLFFFKSELEPVDNGVLPVLTDIEHDVDGLGVRIEGLRAPISNAGDPAAPAGGPNSSG